MKPLKDTMRNKWASLSETFKGGRRARQPWYETHAVLRSHLAAFVRSKALPFLFPNLYRLDLCAEGINLRLVRLYDITADLWQSRVCREINTVCFPSIFIRESSCFITACSSGGARGHAGLPRPLSSGFSFFCSPGCLRWDSITRTDR